MQKLGVQPEQIRELCQQAHVIKAMFVAIVNNSVSTVKRWDLLSVCHHYLSRDSGECHANGKVGYGEKYI